MNSESGEIAHILQEIRICFPEAMHRGSQQSMPLSLRNLIPFLSDGNHYSLCLCLIRFIIAAMKDHDQSNLCIGGRRYLAFASTSLVIIKGNQKRNSNRLETKRLELMQKYLLDYFCLLACCLWIVHPAFYRTYESSAGRLKHSRYSGPPHQLLI